MVFIGIGTKHYKICLKGNKFRRFVADITPESSVWLHADGHMTTADAEDHDLYSLYDEYYLTNPKLWNHGECIIRSKGAVAKCETMAAERLKDRYGYDRRYFSQPGFEFRMFGSAAHKITRAVRRLLTLKCISN